MKSAATAPQSGQIEQTTITKQTLPAPSGPRERTTPEFWEYIEALKPDDWEEHVIYLYRVEQNGGLMPLEKVIGAIELSPGQVIPFDNREDAELAVKQKYGGKNFRLILKRRNQRVCEGRMTNDAPPKYPSSYDPQHNPNSGPSVAPATESSSTADVARTAISTLAQADRSATEVAISALRGAADVVQRLAATEKPAANSLNDEVMRALLLKALNPPDPLETISRLMPLIRNGEAPAAPGAVPAASSQMFDKIMTLALERLVNPPASTGVVSTGAELVRALPGVASYITDAMREWRAGIEAQRDTAAMMSGRAPAPRPPGAPQPGAQILPPPQQQIPQPATPAQGANNVGISLEFVESKIIEILKDGNLSAPEAADDALSFLDRLAPELVHQLSGLGQAGLLQLFNTRPILQQATANTPRLLEFIKSFLEFAAAGKTAAPGSPTPPAPPQ